MIHSNSKYSVFVCTCTYTNPTHSKIVKLRTFNIHTYTFYDVDRDDGGDDDDKQILKIRDLIGLMPKLNVIRYLNKREFNKVYT